MGKVKEYEESYGLMEMWLDETDEQEKEKIIKEMIEKYETN